MTRAQALKKLRSQAEAIKALGATSLYLFGSTARNKANAKIGIDLGDACRCLRFGRRRVVKPQHHDVAIGSALRQRSTDCGK